MSGKDYMTTLSSEELYDLLDWLMHIYARGYSDSRLAIIQWLDTEYTDEQFKQYLLEVK